MGQIRHWIGFLLIFQAFGALCFAHERAEVLPRGVYHPQVIFGDISGIEDRYNSNGMLEGVTAKYHVNLNAATLARIDASAAEKLNLLNTQFATNYRFGDNLSLGTLDFSANPQVTYTAPLMAYGLTDNVTIAIGVPIVRIRTNVDVRMGGVNNVAAIRDLARYGSGTQAFDAHTDVSLTELSNLNLISKFDEKLAQNGYRARYDYDRTAPGDMTVTAIYKYHSDRYWDLAVRPYIILPTGTKDDPDDVFDVPTGGTTAVGLYSIHDLKVSRIFTFGTALGYKFAIPDHREARVPRDEFDFLPGPDRKEDVNRQLGNELAAEGSVRAKILRPVEVGLAYEYTQKDADQYSGSHADYNYSLLGRDTATSAHTIRADVGFSTVDWYLRKMFAIPFAVSYSYSNTILAVNAPNIQMNQFALKAFF